MLVGGGEWDIITPSRTWHIGNVNGALEMYAVSLQRFDRGQILHANAFHVLCATRNNPSSVVDVRRKWWMCPQLFEHRHHVHVRIENDRWCVGLLAQPCQHHNGFLLDGIEHAER